MERKNVWSVSDAAKKEMIFKFCEDYKKYISDCKTERECAAEAVKIAKAAGYRDLKEVIAENGKLKTGDKVYACHMGKTLALFNIGKEPLENGMKILGAHIDSPRIDIKQNPLYEDSDMALLDTHYYGGIKKYQWVALPLAMHGVVALKDGTTLNVVIGEDKDDPVLGVTDLLIHLAAEQMEKKGAKVVEGENLDILIGSIPEKEEDKKDDKDAKASVKTAMLRIFKEKYGIEEEDFFSAELEVVPAGPCREPPPCFSRWPAVFPDRGASHLPKGPIQTLSATDRPAASFQRADGPRSVRSACRTHRGY